MSLATSSVGLVGVKLAPVLQTTDTLASNTTDKHFTIKVHVHASCKTFNVVYLIECRRCGLQYVGETGQPLHTRMNGHRFDITHGRIKESPVATHFNTTGYTVADLTVLIINRLQRNDTTLRGTRESRYIKTLDSLWPRGMNLHMNGL